MIEAEGVDAPTFTAGYAQILLINRVELFLLFLVVADMAIKPGG